jgi:threonine dehydratase
MRSRMIVAQYVTSDNVKVTICKPNQAPKQKIAGTRHLGKSDSSVAKFTGRHNHA